MSRRRRRPRRWASGKETTEEEKEEEAGWSVGRAVGRRLGREEGGRHSGLPKLCNICFYTGADPNLMQLIKRVGDLDTATEIETALPKERRMG